MISCENVSGEDWIRRDNSSLPGIFPWTAMPSCPAGSWVSTALGGTLNGPLCPPPRGPLPPPLPPLSFGRSDTALPAHRDQLCGGGGWGVEVWGVEGEGGVGGGGGKGQGWPSPRLHTAWASPGNLLEMQNLGPTPELANQTLRFNKSPSDCHSRRVELLGCK